MEDVENLSTEYLKNEIKIIARELNSRNECSINYEAGFKLLMTYFDSFTKEQQESISNKLTLWGL